MSERAGGGLRGEFVVTVPLRVGAARAPKKRFPVPSVPPLSGKGRRIAGLSAAAAVVVGVGAATAFFVDYLADRALARSAEAPVVVKPVVAKAVDTSLAAKVASIAAPVATAPAAEPIAAAKPDAAAIAKVAIGPEHAIELPADDPTASPTVRVAALDPDDAAPAPDELGSDAAFGDQPAAMEASSDDTQTAAIAPDAPAVEAKAKPRKTSKKATPSPEARETRVASLPGVDIGGLAGHPSDDKADASESAVRTITKPAKAAAAKPGGIPAGSARVTSAVNLRSSPKKGAGVLTVVPAGSAVDVLSCDSWCRISWNGRTGWVYKNFLAGSAGKQKAAQAAGAPERAIQSSRL